MSSFRLNGLAALTLVAAIVAGAEEPAAAPRPAETMRVRILASEESPEVLGFWTGSALTVLEECGESGSCRFEELGEIGGSRWFFRQRKSGDQEDPRWDGALIEKPPSREARVVWSANGDATLTYLDDLAWFTRGGDTFLLVPVVWQGSAFFHDDQLFRWKGDHWQQVEVKSWWPALGLEPCYEMREGPFLDFPNLAIDTELWLPQDGSTQPSGGRLEVSFKVENDRLVPAEWKLSRVEEEGGDPVPTCGSRLGPCPPCRGDAP